MKSTLINIIAALVKRLVGADLWTAIQISVEYQDTENKTGSEKRDAVAIAMRSISPVAGWIINLAIETAVAKLRASK